METRVLKRARVHVTRALIRRLKTAKGEKENSESLDSGSSSLPPDAPVPGSDLDAQLEELKKLKVASLVEPLRNQILMKIAEGKNIPPPPVQNNVQHSTAIKEVLRRALQLAMKELQQNASEKQKYEKMLKKSLKTHKNFHSKPRPNNKVATAQEASEDTFFTSENDENENEENDAVNETGESLENENNQQRNANKKFNNYNKKPRQRPPQDEQVDSYNSRPLTSFFVDSLGAKPKKPRDPNKPMTVRQMKKALRASRWREKMKMRSLHGTTLPKNKKRKRENDEGNAEEGKPPAKRPKKEKNKKKQEEASIADDPTAHPSWRAKQLEKQKMQTASFSGQHLTFGDDDEDE